MAVRFHVFLEDNRLPSRDEWQSGIDRRSINLVLPDFSTREHAGFLPTRLNAAPCGFEYSLDTLNESDMEDLPRAFGKRFTIATFVARGGRDVDCEAAMLGAAVLAELSNGVYDDPQGGGFAVGAKAFALIREQEIARQERRRLQAAAWERITNRRCPECASPCPEYRKTCKVCGFEVGRV